MSWPPKRPDIYDGKTPEWVVMQESPHRWRVWVAHGVFRIGPDGLWWTRWSEKAAVAKGKRELARYVRELNRTQVYGAREVRGS